MANQDKDQNTQRPRKRSRPKQKDSETNRPTGSESRNYPDPGERNPGTERGGRTGTGTPRQQDDRLDEE